MQYDITGGSRPGGGTNLFLSFGQFNVPANNIANFLNDSGLPTSNILGRVTGGNISNIFGTIQTTGFGNANLFLMNPAGFLFGPNATVNVGGMVAFTSADYLRLGDGVRFNAIPNEAADALLTPSPVAAFGFLGSNPGAITVQGSQFTVTEGSGISLIGGDIAIKSGTLGDGTIQAARLAAPGGQIHLASVASPGELLNSSLQSVPNAQGESFTTMGNLSLSQGATIDVSGNAAGTVRIRGGEFVVTESMISADTANANAAPSAIDIGLTGTLSLANNTTPALTARTNGSGNAGEIRIASESFTARTTTTDSSFALIDTHTSWSGQAGRVTIETGTLDARSNGPAGTYLIDSGTAAEGNGNDVTITASTVSLFDMNISTGDFRAIFSSPQNFDASGSGGNISIFANTINLDFSVLVSQAFQGQAGNISLTGRDITMNDALMGAMGLLGSGAVTINANRFTMTNGSQIETETAFAPGRDITITSNVLELTNGSTIRTQTSGPEPAGNIIVTATDHVTLSDPPLAGRPSGFYSNSVGVEDVELDTLGGNAGSIVVTTPRLTLLGGARIDSTTQTSGRGGDITLNVTEAISLSGELQFPPLESFFTLGSTTAGGVFTRSIGGNFCSGPCGDAGNISITAGSMTLGSGGQINSGTSTAGRAGDITIQASDSISLSGTLNDGSSAGVFSVTNGTTPDAGSGGNIAITANTITLQNGSTLSAKTTGEGNAGNILVQADSLRLTGGAQLTSNSVTGPSGETPTGTAGSITVQGLAGPAQSVLIDGTGSGIFTNTQGTGAGGTIVVNANSATLQNGATMSASSTGTIQNPGNAGNIDITATNGFRMQNSTIRTQAGNGAGGGDIKITTSPEATVYLQDSTVSASVADGPGGGGNISIDPQFVILQNSKILAQAAQGQGGAISITANLFLSDANSIVNADSGSGVNGTVTIQSPNSPASSKIMPLSQKPLIATSLLSQRCAAQASGELSSLTVAGRDSLPAEPGSWLSSPLALAGRYSGSTLNEGDTRTSLNDPAREPPLLSLRQIAPPGFLTRAFAVDTVAGCAS